MTDRLLLVDRPTRSTLALADALAHGGLAVRHAADEGEALALLGEQPCEACVAGAEACGPALLRALEHAEPRVPLVLLADFAGQDEIEALLRRGAKDVLVRPVDDASVLAAVRRVLEHRSLRAENERLREALSERSHLGALVSRDPRMRRVFQTVEAVAESRASLLILGESGTGKTVLARAVHERSGRAGPFVVVNCGALPSTLLESELFGHARGAFTGAVRDRVGKFESADGGTLFLDEIATAPLELQVKLLRVLEEGRFERVGETSTREADVRVIAATNVDLRAEIAAGRFRADLYYRIHVVGVDVPPLRERPLDVPLLAERFLERFAREHARDVRAFAPDALARLCAHPWPGNVRELENTVERAVLLARSPRLGQAELWPGEAADGGPAAPEAAPWDELPLGPLKAALAIPERWILLRALRHCGGNRQETARTLGINRTTLFNKMRRHGLSSFPTQERRGEDPDLRQAS